MIEMNIKSVALRWDFSFFAVLALFFWLYRSGFGVTALSICAAHELAHLAVMKCCGIPVESVTFYGAGIRITAPLTEMRSPAVQAAVYCAGCVMNFLLAGVLFGCGQYNAAAVSLFSGIFNLLPVGEFDGRKLLRLLFTHSLPAERIDSALYVCGVISVLVGSAAVFVIGKGASITLVSTMAYLIVLSLKKM